MVGNAFSALCPSLGRSQVWIGRRIVVKLDVAEIDIFVLVYVMYAATHINLRPFRPNPIDAGDGVEGLAIGHLTRVAGIDPDRQVGDPFILFGAVNIPRAGDALVDRVILFSRIAVLHDGSPKYGVDLVVLYPRFVAEDTHEGDG